MELRDLFLKTEGTLHLTFTIVNPTLPSTFLIMSLVWDAEPRTQDNLPPLLSPLFSFFSFLCGFGA